MKTLVVYDSMFGNTEKIARAMGQAMGEALGSAGDVQVIRCTSVTPQMLGEASLLVMGSPTQGFKPTKEMKAFLSDLPAGSLNGKRAAAFDTRADVAEINNKLLTFLTIRMGYAAEDIAKLLKKKGANLISAPQGFIVDGKEGPLRSGELEHAAAWAQKLAT